MLEWVPHLEVCDWWAMKISDGVHVGLRSCRLHHMTRKMFSHLLIKIMRGVKLYIGFFSSSAFFLGLCFSHDKHGPWEFWLDTCQDVTLWTFQGPSCRHIEFQDIMFNQK